MVATQMSNSSLEREKIRLCAHALSTLAFVFIHYSKKPVTEDPNM
jgi:hypothetical protein